MASSIRGRADDKTSINTINDDLRDALLAAMTLVRVPPRHVRVNHCHATRWVFSDAAVEPDGHGSLSVTIGGVLLEDDATPLMHYSEVVPRRSPPSGTTSCNPSPTQNH